MVDQRGKVHHILGEEQAEMDHLRRPLYRGLSLEQTDEFLPQSCPLDSYSLAKMDEETIGTGRRAYQTPHHKKRYMIDKRI